MIIVEGPDGAGKTTLVEQLERDWGLTRERKQTSAQAVSLMPPGAWIEEQLDMGFGMRLYDRFALISSPLYTFVENRTMVEPLLQSVSTLRHHYSWVDSGPFQHRRLEFCFKFAGIEASGIAWSR